MKKAVKYISLSLCLFLFASVFAYCVFQWMRIDRIEIEIEKSFAWDQSVEQIRSRIQKKLQPFIGQRVRDISLEELIRIVQSEPRVGSVGVVRLLPRHLLVQIQVRKPLLVLLDTKGYMHPLSIDGALLPPLDPHQAPDLPIIRGPAFFKQVRLRKLAIAFIQKIPTTGELSLNSISEVHYSPQEDSLYFILDQNSERIMIGKDPQQIKVDRIESVLQYLRQQRIKWRVIDVRFSQKIVVSTR